MTKKDTSTPNAPKKPNLTLGKRQRRLLSETIQVEDELIPYYARPLVYLVLAMLVAFFIWAALTKLTEVAFAPGEIMPTGKIKVIQHLNGGIIAEIFVDDGDYVNQGDLLVKLDDTRLLADLRQLEGRLIALKLRAERQRAFISGEPASFESIPDDYLMMISAQEKLLDNQVRVKDLTLTVINRQVQQRKVKLDQLGKALAAARQQRQVSEKMLRLHTNMAQKQLITRVTLLETERNAINARSEEDRLIQEINLVEQELVEYQTRYYETQNQMLQEPLEQLGQIEAELVETEQEIIKINSLLEEATVKAPTSGFVLNLSINNAQQVIQPGSLLMEIVPKDVELLAEVRVMPDDLAYVAAGQKVNVKVSSYDFTRYGYAIGKLSKISASSSLDEEGKPYFKAWVELESNYLAQATSQYPLMPGMLVTADILTGEKTLLAYLLDPVTKGLEKSFKER